MKTPFCDPMIFPYMLSLASCVVAASLTRFRISYSLCHPTSGFWSYSPNTRISILLLLSGPFAAFSLFTSRSFHPLIDFSDLAGEFTPPFRPPWETTVPVLAATGTASVPRGHQGPVQTYLTLHSQQLAQYWNFYN